MTGPSTETETVARQLARALVGNGAEGDRMVELLEQFASEIVGRSQTGVYSDIQIARAVMKGHIVIHPLIPDNIKGSSYDVTLGEFFYATSDDILQFDPFNEASIRRYFGDHHTAGPNAEVADKFSIPPLQVVGPEHQVIPIKPGERLLCHTNEYIGIQPPGTTEMRARSSTGRIGIASCFCAGWGDPGYINRWTMEVYNLNQRAVVLLPVNMRISQLIFKHSGASLSNYGADGKYQSGTDLDALMSAWKPSDMLPRMFRDQVMAAMPIEIPAQAERESMLAPWLQAAT